MVIAVGETAGSGEYKITITGKATRAGSTSTPVTVKVP
jgi:uncharacterized membrane protein